MSKRPYDGDSYRDRGYGIQDRDAYRDRDSNRNGNRDRDGDRYRGGDRDSDCHRDRDGHGHRDGPQQKRQKDDRYRPQHKQERPLANDLHGSSVEAPSPLPSLPPIKTDAPFRHSSSTNTSRMLTTEDTSYEKLEFLGDAHLELWASKLIHKRYHHLPAGRMSQVRELLVKNETLAVYSKAYGFDQKLEASDLKSMQANADKSNKGFRKVLGDIFEAYVAAVCLADEEKGEKTGQEWVTALWEPALQQLQNDDPTLKRSDGEHADPRTTFNDRAKEALQQRLGSKEVKLEYVTDKPGVELKGNQLGQNRHFIALYLTGFGHEKKLLAKGEGKNKTEAGHWAAIEAMYGDTKDLVDELEVKVKEAKEKRKQENLARSKSTSKDSQDGSVDASRPE